MAKRITLHQDGGKWVARAGGAVVAESHDVLILSEEGYADVPYFPRDDVAMAFLQASDTRTHCPHKGDARYFSAETGSDVIEDAAWSYETPLDGVAEIAGHIAFDADKVAVEAL